MKFLPHFKSSNESGHIFWVLDCGISCVCVCVPSSQQLDFYQDYRVSEPHALHIPTQYTQKRFNKQLYAIIFNKKLQMVCI